MRVRTNKGRTLNVRATAPAVEYFIAASDLILLMESLRAGESVGLPSIVTTLRNGAGFLQLPAGTYQKHAEDDRVIFAEKKAK